MNLRHGRRYREWWGVLLIGGCLAAGPVRAAYEGPVDLVEAAFSPQGDGLPLILDTLKRARDSVDVAMFYLSNNVLIDALCFLAHRTPVAVRVIVDEGMARGEHRATLERLVRSGASVYVEDLPRAGKLHLKMAVVDDETVLTGSSNWTEFAFRSNCEDSLALTSRRLAAWYREAFEDTLKQSRPWTRGGRGTAAVPDRFPAALSGDQRTGSLKAPARKRFREVRRVEAYLTPGSQGVERLVELIGRARRRIDVGIFFLSDQRVVNALCDAAGSAPVRVLTDDLMLGDAHRGSLERLHACGAAVYCRKADAASMHLKTAVLDGQVVVTGSHNWTRSASDRNVEDLLVFHSPDLAAYYQAYLEDLVEGHAVPWGAHAGAERDRARRRAAARRLELDRDPFPESLPPTGPREDFAAVNARPVEEPLTVRGPAAYLDDEAYLPVLLDLVRTARQSIVAAMHLVAPHDRAPSVEQVLEGLAEAAERGVFVYLVLDTPADPDDPRGALHSDVADRLRRRGVDVRLGVPGVTLHENAVVVDLAKVLVGSHHWTEGSLSGRTVEEASALILLPVQKPALGRRILGHPVVSDMRNRAAWEREIAILRRLDVLEGEARTEAVRRLEALR